MYNTILSTIVTLTPGPPGSEYVTSYRKPRHGNAVFTLWENPPTSHCPNSFARAESVSQGRYWKLYHKLKVRWWVL